MGADCITARRGRNNCFVDYDGFSFRACLHGSGAKCYTILISTLVPRACRCEGNKDIRTRQCVLRVSKGAANSERRAYMALYALQTAYAPVGWAALLKDPQNRMEAVKPVVQRLGGSVVDGWLTFGDYDVLVICQLPDNVSATALSMAISAGGAVKSVKTMPLVTFDEGLEALNKAKDAGYTPPPSEVPYFGVYRGA